MDLSTAAKFSTTIKTYTTIGSSGSMSGQPFFEKINGRIPGAPHRNFPCTSLAVGDQHVACFTVDALEPAVA